MPILTQSCSLFTLEPAHVSVVLWTEFYHWDQLIMSSGPKNGIEVGEYLEWESGVRQAVSFLSLGAADGVQFRCELRIHPLATSELSSSSSSVRRSLRFETRV